MSDKPFQHLSFVNGLFLEKTEHLDTGLRLIIFERDLEDGASTVVEIYESEDIDALKAHLAEWEDVRKQRTFVICGSIYEDGWRETPSVEDAFALALQEMEAREKRRLEPVPVVEAEEPELHELIDTIDGLKSDLDAAVEVAWKHGAIDWVKMNYPKHADKFMERENAREKEEQKASAA